MNTTRNDINKLEKKMRTHPSAATVMELAEKYVESGAPYQAVAILLEGTDRFPDHLELHYLCARFIIMYQPDEIAKAEGMIKTILNCQPDNTVARKLLEQIQTCVETMHEVASPYGADMSELPTIKTAKVDQTDGFPFCISGDLADCNGFPEYHNELTKGYRLFQAKDYEEAINVFGQILEVQPDNANAREGFRLAYAELVQKRETMKKQNRIEVVGRSIQFLESMKRVAQNRYQKDLKEE